MALPPARQFAPLHQVETAKHAERRLAQLEFRAMMDEIQSGLAFDVSVSFGARPRRAAPAAQPRSTVRRPPGVAALSPPLGITTIQTTAPPLASTAILISDVPHERIGAELIEFLTEHNRKPFIRPLFLCESMAPIPLLSRYGFVCVPLQNADPVTFVQRIAARFNLVQLRALSDGRLLWAAVPP